MEAGHHLPTVEMVPGVPDRASSPLLPIICGVPQGIILGPLLFLIYIHDLPEQIHFATFFADAIKLLTDVNNELQELDTLNKWCKELMEIRSEYRQMWYNEANIIQSPHTTIWHLSINNRDFETTHSQ